ncbi:hypothetical protein DL93DRAFT_2230583 [Clavulina sp. PMI_390]|nr:hypothetical protein DL93DRAFT_2230583 [Clavulina sp. PMI_390]
MSKLSDSADVFRPPNVNKPPQLPPRHLDSSQDLLRRLQLQPAYDQYVRPFVRPHGDKGKGKETEPGEQPDPGNNRIPHGLKSFMVDLPGKTSVKRSEPLVDLVLAPPKQRIEVATFDARTLENFRLGVGREDDDPRKKKKPHPPQQRPDGPPAMN